MNIVPGTVTCGPTQTSIQFLGTSTTLSATRNLEVSSVSQSLVEIGLRPQDLHWRQDAPSRCQSITNGRITTIEPTGAKTFVTVDVGGIVVNTRFPSFAPVRSGDEVDLAFDSDDLHMFDPEHGRSLLSASRAAAAA